MARKETPKMRVDLDAKVRTHDGEDAGSVQRAVVDPRTNEVMELVITTGGWLDGMCWCCARRLRRRRQMATQFGCACPSGSWRRYRRTYPPTRL